MLEEAQNEEDQHLMLEEVQNGEDHATKIQQKREDHAIEIQKFESQSFETPLCNDLIHFWNEKELEQKSLEKKDLKQKQSQKKDTKKKSSSIPKRIET